MPSLFSFKLPQGSRVSVIYRPTSRLHSPLVNWWLSGLFILPAPLGTPREIHPAKAHATKIMFNLTLEGALSSDGEFDKSVEINSD